jgi:hypothetical protein
MDLEYEWRLREIHSKQLINFLAPTFNIFLDISRLVTGKDSSPLYSKILRIILIMMEYIGYYQMYRSKKAKDMREAQQIIQND